MKETSREQDHHPFTDEEMKTALERFEQKQAFKQRWKAIIEEEKKTTTNVTAKVVDLSSRKRKNWQWWAMAATVALAIGFFAFWMLSSPSFQNGEALAGHYAESLTELPVPGLQMSDENEQLIVQLNNFKSQSNLNSADYENIITLINAATDSLIQAEGLELTRGFAHFKLKNYKSAVNDLESFIQQGERPIDNALHYLSLSYIALEEWEKAEESLQQLKRYKPTITEKLLKEIKKLRE